MRSFVQEKSYGSVKVFWLDRERLLQALEEKAAELLATFPEVLAVVLFGSLARGEATAFSDADLLVLLRDTPLPFPERLVRYRPEGVRRVEVFPYTLSEAVEGLKGGSAWSRPPSGKGSSSLSGRGPGRPYAA